MNFDDLHKYKKQYDAEDNKTAALEMAVTFSLLPQSTFSTNIGRDFEKLMLDLTIDTREVFLEEVMALAISRDNERLRTFALSNGFRVLPQPDPVFEDGKSDLHKSGAVIDSWDGHNGAQTFLHLAAEKVTSDVRSFLKVLHNPAFHFETSRDDFLHAPQSPQLSPEHKDALEQIKTKMGDDLAYELLCGLMSMASSDSWHLTQDIYSGDLNRGHPIFMVMNKLESDLEQSRLYFEGLISPLSPFDLQEPKYAFQIARMACYGNPCALRLVNHYGIKIPNESDRGLLELSILYFESLTDNENSKFDHMREWLENDGSFDSVEGFERIIQRLPKIEDSDRVTFSSRTEWRWLNKHLDCLISQIPSSNETWKKLLTKTSDGLLGTGLDQKDQKMLLRIQECVSKYVDNPRNKPRI